MIRPRCPASRISSSTRSSRAPSAARPGQIARELDAAGGTFRAWTSFDQTAYQILLAAPYADTGIDILADVLTSATFDAG